MNLKKGGIEINSLFYILMIIIFVLLLVFGFKKIFIVNDILSQQEEYEIKKNLKETYEYCNDPLNKGNYRNFEIINQKFNALCILGDNFYETKYSKYEDFIQIFEGGDNLILIQTDLRIDGENYILHNYNIMDSIKIDIGKISSTFCNFDKDNSGKLLVEIKCS